jgi:hypothetical protein
MIHNITISLYAVSILSFIIAFVAINVKDRE